MSDLKEQATVEDLGFDPSLKKKKKKKTVSVEGEDKSEAGASTTEADELFNGLKKKKKKSSSSNSNSTKEDTAESVDDLSESLGELKLKKKKKKSATPTVVDDFEKQLEQAGVLADDKKEGTPDLGSSTGDLKDESSSREASHGAASSSSASQQLSYSLLLSRFFKILKENNPELAGERSGPKFRIPPPVVQREGAKRTLFANVQEISQVLQRSPEHLIQYLFAELGTSGSIDGQKRLIIKGRFQPKQIETVLRKYVIEYVTCKTCKSMNTELKRESANRLHFIVCKACGSTRSVSSIKTGFQAHIGRRKKVA